MDSQDIHPAAEVSLAALAEEEDKRESDGEEEEVDDVAHEFMTLQLRVAELEAQESQLMQKKQLTLRMARREGPILQRFIELQQKWKQEASQVDVFNGNPVATAAAASSSGAVPGAEPEGLEEASIRAAEDADPTIAVALVDLIEVQHLLKLITTRAERLRYKVASAEILAQAQQTLPDTLPQLAPPSSSDGSDRTAGMAELPASTPSSPSFSDAAKGTSDLTSIGNTIGKLLGFFKNPALQNQVGSIAAALSQLGHANETLVQKYAALVRKESDLTSQRQRLRTASVEWGIMAANLYAAETLQALAPADATRELCGIAQNKILHRNRAALLKGMAAVVLRGLLADGHAASPPPRSTDCSGQPEQNTAEAMQTQIRLESLRDKLLRELAYLRRRARQEGTQPTPSSDPATADQHGERAKAAPSPVCAAAEAALRTEVVQRLTELLTAALAAEQSVPESPEAVASATADNFEVRDGEEEAQASRLRAGLPSELRAMALWETIHTRGNSLAFLLIDLQKQWHRMMNLRWEAEAAAAEPLATQPVVEALLIRCSIKDGVFSSSTGNHDGVAARADIDAAATESPSNLLEVEQQILSILHLKQQQFLELGRQTLTRIHQNGIVALQQVKHRVVLLVRLLQLADEEAQKKETVMRTSATSPLLEHRLGTLSAAETPSYFTSLQLAAPVLPPDLTDVQQQLSSLSTSKKQAVVAEAERRRKTVKETQQQLDRLAQHSTSEAAKLVELHQAALLQMTEELHQRSSRATDAAATLQLRLNQTLARLESLRKEENPAVKARCTAMAEEVARLEIEIQRRRPWKLLRTAEVSARAELVEMENVEWAVLLDQQRDGGERCRPKQDENVKLESEDCGANADAGLELAEAYSLVKQEHHSSDDDGTHRASYIEGGVAPPSLGMVSPYTELLGTVGGAVKEELSEEANTAGMANEEAESVLAPPLSLSTGTATMDELLPPLAILEEARYEHDTRGVLGGGDIQPLLTGRNEEEPVLKEGWNLSTAPVLPHSESPFYSGFGFDE